MECIWSGALRTVAQQREKARYSPSSSSGRSRINPSTQLVTAAPTTAAWPSSPLPAAAGISPGTDVRSRATKGPVKETFNLYSYKQELLSQYLPVKGEGPTIGLPMGLNLYELYPFWHTFFKTLGFGVVTTGPSSRQLYFEGQHTIPPIPSAIRLSFLHGHMEALLRNRKSTLFFYPCMSYNLMNGMATTTIIVLLLPITLR